jgi:hypothetical protein
MRLAEKLDWKGLTPYFTQLSSYTQLLFQMKLINILWLRDGTVCRALHYYSRDFQQEAETLRLVSHCTRPTRIVQLTNPIRTAWAKHTQQERQRTCNVSLRHVRSTIVVVEKQ